MIYSGNPEIPIKLDDLGVPPFSETPKWILWGILFPQKKNIAQIARFRYASGEQRRRFNAGASDSPICTRRKNHTIHGSFGYCRLLSKPPKKVRTGYSPISMGENPFEETRWAYTSHTSQTSIFLFDAWKTFHIFPNALEALQKPSLYHSRPPSSMEITPFNNKTLLGDDGVSYKKTSL